MSNMQIHKLVRACIKIYQINTREHILNTNKRKKENNSAWAHCVSFHYADLIHKNKRPTYIVWQILITNITSLENN